MGTNPCGPRTPGYRRWSPGRVEEFLKCGVKYMLKYRTWRFRAKTALALGRGIHSASEADNLKKKEEGKAIGRKEARDISVAQYDLAFTEKVKNEVDGKEYEVEVVDSKEEIEKGRDKAASGGEAFIELVSPTVKLPEYVEQPVNIQYDLPTGGVELSGVLDLTESGIVRDLKTGKTKTEAYAHGLQQLSAYGLAYQAVTGALASGYTIDSLSWSKKAGWSFKRLWTKRTKEDLDLYWQRVMLVDDLDRRGIYIPASEGAWWCSNNYCEMWDICPHVATRRRLEKSDDE